MAVYDDGRHGTSSDSAWHRYSYDDGLDPAQAGPSLAAQIGGTASRLTTVAGALVSLALVAGLGVWGYKLLVRDVTGIPVVKAMDGPMRIAPADPGGSVAEHQGLAVNAIAAEGEAEPTADRLVLAPRPVELTDEDMTAAELAPEVPETLVAQPKLDDLLDQAEPEVIASTAEAGEVAPVITSSDPVQIALQLAEQIAAEVQPLAAAPAPDLPKKISLIPQPRPVRLASTNAMVATDAIPQSGSDEVDAADVPSGARLVQFGAYDTPELARAEWDRLSVRFEDFMAGKSRVIQEASSGGRTFYRLRAMGFEDLADTRRFCAALQAEKSACIPATAR